MSKPADVFPKLTRAEQSAQRKAAQAIKQAAHDAEVAERRAMREADRARSVLLAASARASAQARAAELVTIPVEDIPKTQGEVRALAKALTPRMMQLLVEIAEDPTQQASGRVAAINALIDRAHGKPVQPNVELPGDVLRDLDDDQLDMFLVDEAKRFIDEKVLTTPQNTRKQSNTNTGD